MRSDVSGEQRSPSGSGFTNTIPRLSPKISPSTRGCLTWYPIYIEKKFFAPAKSCMHPSN